MVKNFDHTCKHAVGERETEKIDHVHAHKGQSRRKIFALGRESPEIFHLVDVRRE